MNNLIAPVQERVKEFGELAYLCYTGSVTYGTDLPDSDLDIQGFFIPHVDYILGLKNVEHISIKMEHKRRRIVEGTIYDIRKVTKLLAGCNPNVMEMLWVRPSEILYKNSIAQMYLDNRNMFLSKRIKHTYGGYAHAQFHRMDKLNESVNQNKKRLKSFKQFGYDVKNAMHLIRLLMTGYEALVEGEIHVWREDRNYLINIREGDYTFEQIKEIAEKKFELMEQAYIVSKLPHTVDYGKLHTMLKHVLLQKIKEVND